MSNAALILAAGMAAAAGLMGCFAVMRRMALAGDALSHVALPGIGIALALHINPLFGAAAMLLFGSLLVWAVEERSRLTTELVVGVIFSTALAIGSFLTSGPDLIDALFGGLSPAVTTTEFVFGLAAVAAVIGFVVLKKRALVIALVSPDIARTNGIDVGRLNLLYLEMFALTVALGLRYLGVLLMGSLIIIPAAAAKRLSRGLNEMLVVSAGIAVVVTLVGSGVGTWLHKPTGPVIVSLAAAVFFLTLVLTERRAA
jgi:ABC-type Mn2+/Zn2+ transport system permease subunit